MMEMDDATLLNMTKTRLSILRMPESNLQKLALKCIAKNYRLYARKQIKEQNPEQLPKPLRNKVLEEISNHLIIGEPCYTPREMKLRLAMFKRLVNSQTLKVDLTGFMNCHYERVNLEKFLTKLLAVLVDNAPDLEELTIDECGPRRWESRWLTQKDSKTKELAYRLTQLHKLKSLKMFKIQFDKIQHLGYVCRHLPNLQVLWACVNRLSEGAEPYRQYFESCFPSLIVHFIKESGNRPRFKEMEFDVDGICSRNAERLDMVYKSASKMFYFYSFNDNTTAVRTFYTGTPGEFRRVSIEMEDHTRVDTYEGKKYNRYYEDDWKHPTDRMVPVNELMESPDETRFNSIRFVDGGYSLRDAFQIYQPFCWPNVHTFTMENIRKCDSLRLECEISLVAARCPNLERLIIKDVYILREPALNAVNLSSLRELDLDVPKPPERQPGQDEEPQLLLLPSHILSVAPNLERVRLEGTVEFFTVDDLIEVTQMIADEAILRKLQKLQIAIREGSIVEIELIRAEVIPEENLEQVIKVLKTASAFLPRLTEIKLSTLDSERKKICYCRRVKSRNDGNGENESAGIFERLHFYDFLDAYRQ